MASSSSTVTGASRSASLDVAVSLADDVGLGCAAGKEFDRRRRRVEHHRQFLDLDGDEIGGVLRHIRIDREHRRDRIADEAYAAGRQHRLAIGLELLNAAFAEIDRRHVGDVVRRPNRDHAGQRTGFGGIDRNDVSVRMI